MNTASTASQPDRPTDATGVGRWVQLPLGFGAIDEVFSRSHNVKLRADRSPVGLWRNVRPPLDDVRAHVENGGLFGSVPNSFELADGLHLSALDVDRGDASKLTDAYPALASIPSWQPDRMHCYYSDRLTRPNSTWSFGAVGGEVRGASGFLAPLPHGASPACRRGLLMAARAALCPLPRQPCPLHMHKPGTSSRTRAPDRLPGRVEAARQAARLSDRPPAPGACTGGEPMGGPPNLERSGARRCVADRASVATRSRHERPATRSRGRGHRGLGRVHEVDLQGHAAQRSLASTSSPERATRRASAQVGQRSREAPSLQSCAHRAESQWW